MREGARASAGVLTVAKSAPHHNAVVPTVWALSRVQAGQVEHLGIYTTDSKGTQEAERLIRKALGLTASHRFRVEWQRVESVLALAYGRDRHDFRFRLEPWPLDGEA